MTLHEAIEKILKEHQGPMNAKEIADNVNNQRLYQRSDGEPVPPSQITARVKNYPFLFEIDGNMIRLSISLLKEDYQHYPTKNIEDVVKLVNSNLYSLRNISELGSLVLTIQLMILLKKLHVWMTESTEPIIIKSSHDLLNLLSQFEATNEFVYLKEIIDNHLDDFGSLSQIIFPFLYNFVKSHSEQSIHRFLKDYLNNSSYFNKSKSGEYVTPDFINSILVNITKPQSNEVVYDPFAGWCSALVKAFSFNNSVSLIAQELSTEVAEIGRLNLFLNTCKSFEVINTNSLLTPALGKQKADVIISDISRKVIAGELKLKEEHKYDFERFSKLSEANSMAIEMMLSRLSKPNGRLAILVSDGVLYGEINKKLTKHIVENDLLEAVINLPTGSLPHSSLKISILLINLNKRNELTNHVLFIKSDEEQRLEDLTIKEKKSLDLVTSKLADDVINAFSNLKDYGNVKQFRIENSRVVESEFNLNSNRYDPETDETIQQVIKNEKYSKLSQILEVAPTSHVRDYQGDIRVVQISDLKEPGEGFFIDQEKLTPKKMGKAHYKVLGESAILIARIGQKLKPTYFKYKAEKIAIIDNILAFKVKANTINIEYLISQLNSDFFLIQMYSIRTGATIPYFRASDFLQLGIPIPSLSEQINKVANYKLKFPTS